MNIELKPIAESKIRQMGGDICGVLVRKGEKLAIMDDHGRVRWLGGEDKGGEYVTYLEGMNAHLKAELKAARAQGGQGAGVVSWDDPAVDPIVSKLYRKFKEWNRQGFGADDVTWCEVRGYVAELLNAQPQPAVPEGWSLWRHSPALTGPGITIKTPEGACFGFSKVSCHAPTSIAYRFFDALLSTPTTPQADGRVRCDEPFGTESAYQEAKDRPMGSNMNISCALFSELVDEFRRLKRPQSPKEGE